MAGGAIVKPREADQTRRLEALREKLRRERVARERRAAIRKATLGGTR